MAWGIKNVQVLDGGLKAWTFDTDTGDNLGSDETPFELVFDSDQVCTYEQLGQYQGQICDGRPAAEYEKGHIDGAKSLENLLLLTPDFKYKSKDQIRQVFAERGVDCALPVVCYCKTSMRGSVLHLAALEAGMQSKLYDGAYTEYIQRK